MNDKQTAPNLAPLTADDFAAFFSAVNADGAIDKTSPFRWQERFVAEVIASGLPERISLPTATGKTSVVDILLFALAAIRSGATRGANARSLPRRFFFCVDRRLIVDQTARHTAVLFQQLKTSEHSVVRRVRHWLAEGRDDPFALLNWRGGLELPTQWKPDPIAVVVCVATIDQVGSQLLFRGYGSSAKHRPVFAAMIGLDSAIVLDEAHLSAPFVQTAQAIVHWQKQCGIANEIHTPLMQFVQLGATLDPTGDSQSTFELRKDSKNPGRDEWLDPRLRPRLIASKRLYLESSDKPLLDRLVQDTKAGAGKASKIGVVVSSVRLARDVFEKLRESLAKATELPKSSRLFLLTGRNRPFVRDALAKELDQTLATATVESPVILIATQCVEAGYDVSFDYIISDFAVIASLIQRLGRLNRYGECREAVAKIHHRPKETTIYGETLVEHWAWAQRHWKSQDGANVSPLILRKICKANPPPPVKPPHTPMLLAPHLDVLALTNPLPAADLDVDTFLHGQDEGVPDVQVVWRADLAVDNPALWPEIIKALPPRAQESISIPISAARRWLAENIEAAEEISDTDRNPRDDDEKASRRIREAVLYQWQGRDEEPDCQLISGAKELRPGVFLVVPSDYGGCDRFGWSPESKQSVEDIADWLPPRRHARIRLHPAIRPHSDHAKLATIVSALRLQKQDVEPEFDPLTIALELLEDSIMFGGREPHSIWNPSAKLELELHPDGQGIILHVREPSPWAATNGYTEVLLDPHQESVSQRLQQWLAAFGEDVRAALRFAALHHDDGKADPRQQADFHGGDTAQSEAWMKTNRFLAKPRVKVPANRQLPKYCRHELASVAIAAELPEFKTLRERDLALSIIGSHHGRGRAIIVPHDDPNAVTIERHGIQVSSLHRWLTLGCDWLKIFAALNRRFGPYYLAYLQVLLILADEHQSAIEQEDGE